jgi:hypothetical protein
MEIRLHNNCAEGLPQPIVFGLGIEDSRGTLGAANSQQPIGQNVGLSLLKIQSSQTY